MESLSSSISTLDNLISILENALVEEKEDVKGSSKEKQSPKTLSSRSATRRISSESSQSFLKCDLRVGKIDTVACHPDANGLFHLQVRLGKDETRSVCAGLRDHVSEADLLGKLCVLICNLKPRLLRGIKSEAMCLAGSTKGADGSKEKVVPLSVPEGADVGDLISVSGIDGEREVQPGKFVSGKVWEKVVAKLSVEQGVAHFDGSPMRVGNSEAMVTCPGIPDGAEVH